MRIAAASDISAPPPAPGFGQETAMSTLLRLVLTLAVLAGLVVGAMWALATFVEPQPQQVRLPLPPSKLTGKP